VFFFLNISSGIFTLALLTRADEVEEEIRREPNKSFPTISKHYERLSSLFSIPVENIMHNINYTAETSKSFEIDRMTFRILSRSVEAAKEYCYSTTKSTSHHRHVTRTRSNSLASQYCGTSGTANVQNRTQTLRQNSSWNAKPTVDISKDVNSNQSVHQRKEQLVQSSSCPKPIDKKDVTANSKIDTNSIKEKLSNNSKKEFRASQMDFVKVDIQERKKMFNLPSTASTSKSQRGDIVSKRSSMPPESFSYEFA